MDNKLTYEELEKRVEALELEAVERNLAEDALTQSEATLASIFSAAPMGIGLVADRIVKQVNNRMCSMVGYSSDELIGKSARILYPSDEEFKSVGEQKYGQIRKLGTGTVETHWRRKDGELIDILLSSTPLDPSDLSAGVTFTALEITKRKQAEKALREGEERYRRLTEAITDYIYTVSVEDGSPVETVHGAGCVAVTGYSTEDFRADPHLWIQMVHEKDRNAVQKQAEQVISSVEVAPLEHRIIRKDGVVRWVRNTPVPRFAGQEQLSSYDGLIQDITEQHRAQQALLDSEARYRALFENMSNGVAIYEAQNEGEDFLFVGYNKGAERMDNIKRDSLIGKSVLEVFPGVKDFGLFQVFQRVWETGTPEDHPVGLYEDKRIAGWRDNFVYRLPSGEVVAVYSDETERKHAEEALKESYDELELKVKERTAALSEANDRLKREIDVRKQTEEVLRERTHDLGERVKELNCLYGISNIVEQQGISLEEILQGSIDHITPSWQYTETVCARVKFERQEFITANFQETQWKLASDIVVNEEPLGCLEICYLEEKPEAYEGPFLKQERSLINAIAGRLGGIAELFRAEEALRESENRLREDQKRMDVLKFANDVALKLMHELRNPLVTIGGYSRRISDMKCSDDKLGEYGKIIFEQSVRLDNALDEALNHLRNAAEQV